MRVESVVPTIAAMLSDSKGMLCSEVACGVTAKQILCNCCYHCCKAMKLLRRLKNTAIYASWTDVCVSLTHSFF